MRAYKPWMSFRDRDNKHQDVILKRYSDHKKKLKEFMPLTLDNKISITRTRRGEWGQWFEVWELIDGKLKIVKQTWL